MGIELNTCEPFCKKIRPTDLNYWNTILVKTVLRFTIFINYCIWYSKHLAIKCYMYKKATSFRCLKVMFGHSYEIYLNIITYGVTLRASTARTTHFLHYCQLLHSINLSRLKTSFVSSGVFFPHPNRKLTIVTFLIFSAKD